jgi:hypothetical protein
MKLNAFYDSHLHLLGLGYVKTMIDLTDYKSIEEVKEITSDQALLYGRGWHQNQFKEKRFLHKADLNAISKDKPVIFLRVCGHVLVCNDKAMALAGMTQDTPQVEGGTFDLTTGVFSEDAMDLVRKIIPKPTKEDIKNMLIEGDKELLKNGITRCGSDDFSTLDVPFELIIDCLEELYNDGLMHVKLYEQVNLPSVSLLKEFIDKGYVNKSFNGFKMGPLKLLADGSLGGRTAYLNDDYSDESANKGVKVFSDQELYDLIYLADSNGMDVAIHAIGDGIIDVILDTIETVMTKTKRYDHRHSIIHSQLATKSQIKRMKQLNIMPIVQPIFLNSDLEIVHDRLGSRVKESYLFHTMMDEGLNVGFSTDAPVEPVNPFYNIYTALTRQSMKNNALDPLLNEPLFTLDEALTCYTTNNLYHSYEEGVNNDDYIIVDRDIHTCTVHELKETKVLKTVINGKTVYQHN